MNFKLITEGGSVFELNPQQVEELEIEIDGKRYLISIKEL